MCLLDEAFTSCASCMSLNTVRQSREGQSSLCW
jgi:hypothetical protein